jgi:hypothetical protein
MLNDIFLRVKNVTTKYISLVIITLILFSISAILGLFLIGTSKIIQCFEDICLNNETVGMEPIGVKCGDVIEWKENETH